MNHRVTRSYESLMKLYRRLEAVSTQFWEQKAYFCLDSHLKV